MTKPPAKTHLAIFDIDGTLTDSVAPFQASYFAALQPFGFAEIDTNWGGYTHHTDSWIFRKIYETNHGQSPEAHECEKFAAILTKIFHEAIAANPITEISGAARFIHRLETETSWGIAFATGSLKVPAHTKLSVCSIPYAENLVAASDALLTREEIVNAAIDEARKHYGADFQTIVSFGDGEWDYRTARALRLPFIGIGEGPKAERLTKLGNMVFPDFRNPEAILNYMRELEF